jgi:hypothetical protein
VGTLAGGRRRGRRWRKRKKRGERRHTEDYDSLKTRQSNFFVL